MMTANEIAIPRHIICKAMCSYLYSVNADAFGQMIMLLKSGRTIEDAIYLCYGQSIDEFLLSFGQSMGVRGLKP